MENCLVLKEESLTNCHAHSIGWRLQKLEIGGELYISISRQKKWNQDGKFHFDQSRRVNIHVDDVKQILPYIQSYLDNNQDSSKTNQVNP